MQDEWLWGWDSTPGIVSVWAEPDGRAFVWSRVGGVLSREVARYRPWALLASLDDLQHLGPRLQREGTPGFVTYEELSGPGALRFVVRADDGKALTAQVLHGASKRLGRPVSSLRELGQTEVLSLPWEEQYLVASGRTYFKDLAFDELKRLQFDLETTGLDANVDRIFLIALRAPDGSNEVLEAKSVDDAGEAGLIRALVERISFHDPDVIENHNLHGFDLPFLDVRARALGVTLALGRAGLPGLRTRPSSRRGAVTHGTSARTSPPIHPERRGEAPKSKDGDAGYAHPSTLPLGGDSTASPRARDWDDRGPRLRYTVPGREFIDTMDAVFRYDFAARDLPGHGLKAVAKHFGLAAPEREYLPGAQVYETYLTEPARVRHYASDDVNEAAGLARLLGGAAFALSRMAPRRYERLADAGAATGVIDPLLVRAYLRSGAALPAHEPGDGTEHSGAALHLFAAGVATRVVKADVASLYPSLMRQYRIGPARDRLGVLLALVDRLVDQRLDSKAKAKLAPPGSNERFTHEAVSAAMKLIVNSAYGYLGAPGLTRFSDVHAANAVTRYGREVLSLMCRELADRGVTLLEADTDGVYFAVPHSWSEADERRIVADVGALLPGQVHLEFDGRYAAMLSHEPKNYALLTYDDRLLMRGVAFRSSRTEPYADQFLKRAIGRLLVGDVLGVRTAFVDTVMALRHRQTPTRDVTSRVRLTRSPDEYAAQRDERRELPYEAMVTNGRPSWSLNERVRVYRAIQGRAGLLPEPDPDAPPQPEADPRDYDAEYYVNQLRTVFASRLQHALTAHDFTEVFEDPEQPSLFDSTLGDAKPILTVRDESVANAVSDE